MQMLAVLSSSGSSSSTWRCFSVFLLSIALRLVEATQQQQQQYFVYPHAPTRLVLPARRLGKLEHLNYISSVKNVKNDEEKLHLYTHHFSQCSSIGADSDPTEEAATISTSLVEDERQTPAPTLSSSPVERLVSAIGVDPISSKFFNLPASELKATVESACLKNELQFQCAYGFLEDLDKIEEHIQLMKQNDGTFKVMAEKECKLFSNFHGSSSSSQSVYFCVHTHAETILQQCQNSIEAYNSTRLEVNNKMHQTFGATVATIEEHAESAIAGGNSEALENVLRKGESLIESTLKEFVRMEAFKCRHYTQMERCLLGAVGELCSGGSGDSDATSTTVDSLRSILRVGYLQRERSDSLHQQFVEAGVEPHRACQLL